MAEEGLTLALLADSWLFRYSVTWETQDRHRSLAVSCAAANRQHSGSIRSGWMDIGNIQTAHGDGRARCQPPY